MQGPDEILELPGPKNFGWLGECHKSEFSGKTIPAKARSEV